MREKYFLCVLSMHVQKSGNNDGYQFAQIFTSHFYYQVILSYPIDIKFAHILWSIDCEKKQHVPLSHGSFEQPSFILPFFPIVCNKSMTQREAAFSAQVPMWRRHTEQDFSQLMV